MRTKSCWFIFLFLIILSGQIFSAPTVKAVIDSPEYQTGDIISVLVRLDNNPGMHGIYFDLNYDDKVLEFEGVRDSSLIRRLFDQSKLSYAFSDPDTSQTAGAHVIISYTLKGKNTETKESGILVELRFRVVNSDTLQHRFTFNDCAVVNKNAEPISDTVWLNSDFFKISTPPPSQYILIKQPYDNQIFYQDQVSMSLICSDGSFIVRIYEADTPEVFHEVPVTNGRLLNEPLDQIVLKPGFNLLKAELFEKKSGSALVPLNISDKVKVYYSDKSQYVKILSPADHSLLNTDMIEVKAASSFSRIEINGVAAQPTGEKTANGNSIYAASIFLSKGFNTITAIAYNDTDAENRLKFTDSIKVFYQKDDTIFKFVLPKQDEIYKPSAFTKLLIKGEIDSPYKTASDPSTGELVNNHVLLRVIYKPLNPVLKTLTLVNDREAFIKENDYSYENSTSKYIFYNNFDIPLVNLDDGDIYIYAYKNKTGTGYDDMINRIVHIDNKRLWINLVQPNIFTSDHLDNQLSLEEANENKPLDPDGEIEMSGSLRLAKNKPLIKDTGLVKINDMLETPEGDIYALSNTANGVMKIYRKTMGSSVWETVINRPGMYGYSFCSTSIGILIGVSNLFTTDNSGLYLYNNNKLTNFILDEYLPHVQFVKNYNNTVYLYGNNYSFLYSFNLYNLEEKSGKLQVLTLCKDSFPNNMNLKQFYLSRDGSLAMLRNDLTANNTFFYKKTPNGYAPLILPKLDDSDALSAVNIIPGEYSAGEYYAFVAVKDRTHHEVIMVNKAKGIIVRNPVPLSVFEISDSSKISGIGFKNDNFILLYEENGNYRIKRGKIFFSSFFPDLSESNQIYENLANTSSLPLLGSSLYVTDFDEIYAGAGTGEIAGNTGENVYLLYKNLKTEGSARFNYVNEDIDGLTGFEFAVDPRWLATDQAIQFGFKIMEKADKNLKADPAKDQEIFTLAQTDLKALVEAINTADGKTFTTDYYTVNSNYDAGKQKQIIHFDFKELQKNRYLSFLFTLRSYDNVSPEISGIEVFKKVKAKIVTAPGAEIILPIHGYVYDRTVKEVSIQHNPVLLGSDGSFYYEYRITTLKKEIPVEISCRNSAGKTAVIQFTVEIAESNNKIWDIAYHLENETADQPLLPPQNTSDFIINTDRENVYFSGKFFGLRNCLVGYELCIFDPAVDRYIVLKKGRFETNQITDLSDPVWSGLNSENKGDYIAGYFNNQSVGLTAGEQRLVIYCENPGGLRSVYGYWNIKTVSTSAVNSQQGKPVLTEVNFKTDADIITVNGRYSGKNGCVVGYQQYLYDEEAGAYQFSGEDKLTTEVTAGAETDLVEGRFSGQFKKINGEKQQLVIYCKNPDGTIAENRYNLDKILPAFNYNIPESFQKIEFNLDETADETVGNIKITHQVLLNAYEDKTAGYQFIRQYEVTGSIQSLFNFDKLIIKDLSDYTGWGGRLYFENNKSQIEIPVEAGNRFTVKFKVVMGKKELNQTFYLGAVPAMAFKDNLKRGIKIVVRKEFANTDFWADFSDMLQEKWTDAEKKNNAVEFRFQIRNGSVRRDDLPLQRYTTMHLKLNYTEDFTGYVDKKGTDPYLYCLKDAQGKLISLPLDKLRVNAMNRIQWYFEYRDPLYPQYPLYSDVFLISSSSSGREGMKDFLFVYQVNRKFNPTEITFSPNFIEQYYDAENKKLPELIIKKDKTTELSIECNDLPLTLVWVDLTNDMQKVSTSLSALLKDVVIEGKNILKIQYKEQNETGAVQNKSKTVEFNYDTMDPEVVISSYKMQVDRSASNYLELLSLTAFAVEANFKSAYLYYDNNIIQAQPQITIKGKNQYVLCWDNLESYHLKPYTEKPVKVEVRDLSGKSKFSDLFTGLSDIDRPIEGYSAQNSFKMPIYDTDDNSLRIDHEDNYKGRPFNAHTVFAPQKFLKKVSIKNALAGNQNILIKDTKGIEPINTDFTAGNDTGKFLVVKIHKNPAKNILVLDDVKDKITLIASGYKKKDATNETVTFPAQQLMFETGKDAAYVEGYNYFYYITQIFEDKIKPISSQKTGIKGKFYDVVKNNFKQSVTSGESFGEAVLTLSFSPEWGAFSPDDVYISGGDNSSLSDIIVYDPVYEDPEQYRADVTGTIRDKDLYLINNVRGRELKMTAQTAYNSAKYGKSLALSDQYAVIGAPGDLDAANTAVGAVYIYTKNLYGEWDPASAVRLMPDDGIRNQEFGSAVAVAGDYIAVASPGDSRPTMSAGSVYIFKRNNTGQWRQIQKLQGDNSAGAVLFGSDVAVNDQYLFIGAEKENRNGTVVGAVYVYRKSGNGNWQEAEKLFAVNGEADDLFGSAVSVSGNHLAVGAKGDDEKALNAGAVYLYELDSNGKWLLQTKQTASNGTVNAHFGCSVSISDNRILVGASNQVINSKNIGSAYIFTLSGKQWTETDCLSASDASASGGFGISGSIWGNFAIIGAAGEDDPVYGQDCGAAYLFTPGDTGRWQEIKKLNISTLKSGDQLGLSVVIHRDDILTGIPFSDAKEIDAGSVYYFRKSQLNNGDYGEEFFQKLIDRNGKIYNEYGLSVALSGKYAAVGSPYDSDSGECTGSVFVYEKNNLGQWYEAAKLLDTGRAANDNFGYSVALSGNYLFVGVPYDDDKAVDAGSVFVYERNAGGQWLLVNKLMDINGAANDNFGFSVAVSGNYAVVGAPFDDDKGKDSGSAFIFERNTDGQWLEVMKVLDNYGMIGDWLGYSVSISGNTALVGIPADDDTANNAGSVLLYERNAGNQWAEIRKLTDSNGYAGNYFGYAVAVAGGNLIVGSPFDRTKAAGAGSAVIFESSTGGIWQEAQKLQDTKGAVGDWFGNAVAISDNYAAAGAIFDDESGIDSGSAFIYRRDENGQWTEYKKLLNINAKEGDWFGYSVAVTDNDALIGTVFDAGITDYTGSAYIRSLSSQTNFDTTLSDIYQTDYLFTKKPTADPFTDVNRLLPDDLTEYLVFKIKKSGTVALLSDIRDKIQFSYTAAGYNYFTDQYKNYQKNLTLVENTHYFYEERSEYLYYIINRPGIEFIKSRFLAELAQHQPFSDTGDWKVYDRGSLHLVFKGALTEYPDIQILTAVRGRKEIGSDRVADFNHYFYNELDSLEYQTNEYYRLHPALIYPFEKRSVIHNQADTSGKPTDTMTVNFWFRPDDEGINPKDSIYGKLSRRIFTMCDDEKNEIFHVQYKGNMLELYKEKAPLTGDLNTSIYGPLYEFDKLKKDSWFLFSFIFDADTGMMDCGINGKLIKQNVAFDTETMKRLLAKGAVYYFGREAETEYNTGFFSVANAYYINQKLTEDQLSRLANFKGKVINAESEYWFKGFAAFDPDQWGFEDGDNDLFVLSGKDYYAAQENNDYTEGPDSGAFKATSIHINYLNKKTAGDINYLVLNGQGNDYYAYNLSISNTWPDSAKANWRLRLAPAAGYPNGRYYFGNQNSNYGLGQDRWYTVSGNIISCSADAELVLAINGQEQRMKLQPGPFRFVYDNYQHLIPYLVNMYVETEGVIEIDGNMSFNMGNFIIPQTLEKSAASTFFAFDLSGTVHFWYKPLMTDKDGYVRYPLDLSGKSNFREQTLFDSELIKIGIKRSADKTDAAYFYAALKSNADGYIDAKNYFWSKKPVTEGWQHIQLSYDLERKAAYFFINGELASAVENFDIPLFGSIKGLESEVPKEDNVYIGCDLGRNTFAEGYLDDVYIGKYYLNPRYQNKKPVKIEYNPQTLSVELTAGTVNPAAVDRNSIKIIIESLSGSKRMFFTDFPIDLKNEKGGRYRLTADMMINGHVYKEINTFNIADKPCFNLTGFTPIIFKNNETKLKFKFQYDDSYRLSDQTLLYAGAAVRLSYDGNNSPRVYYLVQDFINKIPGGWLQAQNNGSTINWTPLQKTDQGELILESDPVVSASNIRCDLEYFYFKDLFSVPVIHTETSELLIPLAALEEAQYGLDSHHNEYKLIVPISGAADEDSEGILQEMSINYTITGDKLLETLTGTAKLAVDADLKKWKIEIYYDDILPDYGAYTCRLELKYQGQIYGIKDNIPLNWSAPPKDTVPPLSRMDINDFSLLFMDKVNNRVKLYLSYSAENVAVKSLTGELQNQKIEYQLFVKQDNQPFGKEVTGMLSAYDTVWISPEIEIPKNLSIVKMVLKTCSSVNPDLQFVASRELELMNNITAPEIILTNSVDSLIAYNNVFFSWKGYYEGQYDPKIEYSYNFDDSGWITPNSQWRSVSFYELPEGYHQFQVKAVYHGLESAVRTVTFFVDVNKPAFAADKISAEKIYDKAGIAYAVRIKGQEGAIKDVYLVNVYVNNQKVTLGVNGSFETTELPLTTDGINSFTLKAFDKVGNYTDYQLDIDNTLTTLIFPDIKQNIAYSPITLVGLISPAINSTMTIYVQDPFCVKSAVNDYRGWKKARINEDRTFFVDDIFVNPGTKDKEITTTLNLACVFPSGKVFTRAIQVKANEIVLPIELKLSTHAAEGENTNTIVNIDCQANVADISSWSIDFTGDGIYDVIDLVTNPALAASKAHSWEHTYSSLGVIKPRVRIITTGGHYFSVSDTLTIHERIKQPSNKFIDNGIALDRVHLSYEGEDRIFVLCETGGKNRIEQYKIGENDQYITKLPADKTINLDLLGIRSAVALRVLDKEHLFIAANLPAGSRLYELTANAYGNYSIAREIVLPAAVRQITLDAYTLYVSFKEQNYLVSVKIKDKLADPASLNQVVPEVYHTLGLDRNAGIVKDGMGLLATDYYNQRIIRFSHGLKMIEQFGSIGEGEKEFLKPALITSYQNRIFVYDEARQDIQVLDQTYKPVCTLKYELKKEFYNYVDKEFFNSISDMSVISREEQGRLYYYLLILSRSTGQLALLRLPQWEEMRAKMQSNKIVFVKDGEVFTANPDGSDLTRILATDSLPEIEGKVSYPALAGDGRRLIFISKKSLYNSENYGYTAENDEHASDRLYLYDLGNRKLKQLDLGILNNYQIERPVFNYNSDKIIFSAKATGKNWQVYIYDIRQSAISQLIKSDENIRFPYFSPDDRFVVFTTDFDGDEDIAVVELANTNIRYYITRNNCRDSFPVWSRLYPNELVNPDAIDPELEKVKSKISFVSERGKPNEADHDNTDFHKGLYTIYLTHLSDKELQVFDIRKKEINSRYPDEAAVEITNATTEGDYPCYTGDGRTLLFEYFADNRIQIKKFDFTGIDPDKTDEPGDVNRSQLNKTDPAFILNDVPLLEGAVRPAGMKNTITNFTALVQNGNEIAISWDSYTDYNIFYTVQFTNKSNDPDQGEKQVYGDTNAVISGLKLGETYFVRVCTVEREEEIASTRWLEVKLPKVAARPSYQIDPNNPYLVKLIAWTPEPDTDWKISWIIENTTAAENSGKEFYYEFARSGIKTVLLKVTSADGKETVVSAPLQINIISDIEPVIEYVLADDSGSIDLNAANSKGIKIDWSASEWIITGPGRDAAHLIGSNGTVDLKGFLKKINILLNLKRQPIKDSPVTDTIQKSLTIDLELKKLKPVITYTTNPLNKQLVTFSGEHSLGNIDWINAEWTAFGDNKEIRSQRGSSTFVCEFPQLNKDAVYSVTLTVPRRNDGMTETVSQIIRIDSVPLLPKINYEIITMSKGGNTTDYKVIFDCTQSQGNDIDFSQARWSLPMSPSVGESSTQTGPTAVYSLLGIEDGVTIEVALTLFRRNGDARTVTEMIELRTDKFPEKELKVNKALERTDSGYALILDVLNSTGPNINWEKTEWLVDGQYKKEGPMVRIDLPASSIQRVIPFVCTLYRYGESAPEVYRGEVNDIPLNTIIPHINPVRISAKYNNYYALDVLNSEGINIDWERTQWYIYDGNENVIIKQGSKITHTFCLTEEKMGYQVMVLMYFKGDSRPFVGFENIDVDGNQLIPVIQYEVSGDDPNAFVFNAHSSAGASIDWTQTKWTFLDSSESKYGPVVTHKFPVSSLKQTYTVALTLYRRSINNQNESKTATIEVTIGSDQIIPVVKAQVYGDYLVLSADQSKGRGLLLDRAVWLFPGEGDSTNYTKDIQGGVIFKNSFNASAEQYLKNNLNIYTQGQVGTEFDIGSFVLGSGTTFHLGGENGVFFKLGTKTDTDIGSALSSGMNTVIDFEDYSNYQKDTQSFSNSNMHTGSVCRRYVKGKSSEIATLYVYRIESDGAVKGEAVTVKIDLAKARANADSGGVVYK